MKIRSVNIHRSRYEKMSSEIQWLTRNVIPASCQATQFSTTLTWTPHSSSFSRRPPSPSQSSTCGLRRPQKSIKTSTIGTRLVVRVRQLDLCVSNFATRLAANAALDRRHSTMETSSRPNQKARRRMNQSFSLHLTLMPRTRLSFSSTS